MNKTRKVIGVLVALLCIVSLSLAGSIQSKFANTTNGTAAALNFGVADMGWQVKSIFGDVVTADATTAQIEILARSDTPGPVTVAQTNAAVLLTIDNSPTIFAADDKVMYAYSDGKTPFYTTVGSATATTVTLTNGIEQAGTVKDVLYQVDTVAIMVTGTTAFNEAAPVVYASPSDSPMRVTMGTGTNISLVVTAGR